MCGLFGFIGASREREVNLRTLARIAIDTEKRGRHAWGLAWIDADGRLHHHKEPGPITHGLDALADLAGAVAVIGHCRFATVGSPEVNENNHPHACDGGWIAHNGTIENYRKLALLYSFRRRTDTDTETICHLIEGGPGTLGRRAATALRTVQGDTAFLGLWKQPIRLAVARRGKPLWVSTTERGTYLASRWQALPGHPEQIPNHTTTILKPGDHLP